MLRILRAFSWLRWRILLNSLERRGSRDVLERFSIAFEQLAPTIVALVMVPSALALAGAAGYAGWALGHGEPRVLIFELLRYLLFAACGLAVVGPILLPAGERTNAVRLLLLPIPRAVLYLAQAMSALADPWIVLVAAIVFALPLGLAASGSLEGAILAGAAGVLLLVVLIGISLVVTSAVHLIVRDRRRGELLTLLVVVVLPILGMLPGLLGAERRDRRDRGVTAPATESTRSRTWTTLERSVVGAVPSEIYTRATRSAALARSADAARPSIVLAAMAVALHGLAFLAFGRVLSSPGVASATRSAARGASSRWRIPGASPGTSAVAINQLRLALRTPRGRSTILSPVLVFAMFAVMMFRGRGGMEFGPIKLESGVGLASFAAFVSLMSILPLAMNQFAIDRAGLTLTLLSPLETVSLLRGKAIGNGLIGAIPVALCIAGALLLFPAAAITAWLSVPLALVATYLLAAPGAAMLSAIFPRSVDLNSIGRGSNAHGAAGLLGMLSFVAAGVPAALIVLTTTTFMHRPALAPLALALWAAICLALSTWLFQVAAGVFERRRENLGLTCRGTPG